MQNNNNDNRFLSISVLCQPENKVSIAEGMDYIEINNLVRCLSKFIPSFSDNAICKAYNFQKKDKPYDVVIVPSELMSGLIYYDFIFTNNYYQQNLQLENTELNNALFEYLDSALTAIYAEECLACKDIQLEYQYKSTLGSVMEISDNRIQYGMKAFPWFVKSIARLMKELYHLNPSYCVLFCSDKNHVFAESIETHSSPVSVKSDEITEVVGRAVPVYKSADIDYYIFIEHHTRSRYVFSLKDDTFCKILDRAANHKDPIKILVKLVVYKDRDKILPRKDLILEKIITTTRQSREELKRSLIPNTLFNAS